MASVKTQEAALCLIDVVSTDSKTDPPPAKAEPVSSAGSASEITYVRKGKNCCATEAGREE